ncbi:hypothetical protein [Nocardia bovistercoris]|uniref:Uncharacterized protein n=1 Tax=Nocardia bovistercoris TaxID=2785916 RepID=A0A931IIQ4_9NOCA|nr:hypothetical protein [Nocardia bovistercoris]MBH0781333.1 hypothetical protein [Nocardia bovistercoris]
MTSPPITAESVLFHGIPHAASVSELARCLHEHDVEHFVLRRAPMVTTVLRSTALREVTTAMDRLLQMDLGRLCVEGWRRYDRLRGAAMRTRSGGSEQVELLEHEVTQTYSPHLEVTVDGTRVGELDLELRVALLLRPLTATVRGGLLVALGPGDCTATASVAAAEIGDIMRREHKLPVATLVDLRRPIPLVRREDDPPTVRMNRANPAPNRRPAGAAVTPES